MFKIFATISLKYMNKKSISWSGHAIQRAAEYHLKCETLFNAWERSSEMKLSDKIFARKFQQFGMKAFDSLYFYDVGYQLMFIAEKTKRGLKIITVSPLKKEK